MRKRNNSGMLRPLFYLVILAIAYFIFQRFHPFSGIFTSKPLLIDNTPLVIKQIRSIGELNTATLYQEVVVDSVAPASIPFAAKREIVLIVKGTVTAGIDLQKMEAKDVSVQDDSVHLLLPASMIRDVIINPSHIETFYEFGDWNNEEITKLKLTARAKLLEAAAKNNLLQKADVKARVVMEEFLSAAQFKKVVVETKGSELFVEW